VDTAELVDIAGMEDSAGKDKVALGLELGPRRAVVLEVTVTLVMAKGVRAGGRTAVGDWTKPF